MKTKATVVQSIIKITTTIQQEYPELTKFISEMPEVNLQNEEVNIKNLENYRNYLEDIVGKYVRTHSAADAAEELQISEYADLQVYPASEDIYQQLKQETDLNPEDISKNKKPNEKESSWNEKDFKEGKKGADLDVPGSELDDQQEDLGREEEENNYYSLGGDNHST